jgi:hypothetical protein
MMRINEIHGLVKTGLPRARKVTAARDISVMLVAAKCPFNFPESRSRVHYQGLQTLCKGLQMTHLQLACCEGTARKPVIWQILNQKQQSRQSTRAASDGHTVPGRQKCNMLHSKRMRRLSTVQRIAALLCLTTAHCCWH